VVPSIPKWYINQFDYNKDIPSSLSKNRDPKVLSWSSISAYGRLQIEHLGTVFQIYPKGLPDNGDYTRFEGHYYRKKDNNKNLTDTLSDILEADNNNYDDNEEGEPVEKKLPFVTAEDMLKKVKENMGSINDEDSRIPFNDRDTQVS